MLFICFETVNNAIKTIIHTHGNLQVHTDMHTQNRKTSSMQLDVTITALLFYQKPNG